VPTSQDQSQDEGQEQSQEDSAIARVDQALRLLDILDDAQDGEPSPDDLLRRAVALILSAIDGCTAVSITVLAESDVASTIASTAQWATDLDQEQYRYDKGPCLEAARGQLIQRVEYNSAHHRWPEFVAASSAVGVGSYLSAGFPMEDQQVASVNLYGSGPDAFSALDETVTALITRYTALALSSTTRLDDARKLAEQLEKALHSRPVIDWAVGILMAQTPCTPEQAFEMLRNASQRSNVKIRDVANQIVERTAGRGQGEGEPG
jgi:ANTAR domain/GAF domain